jgi:DNA-binding NarL/FixJ family response regulator
MQPASIVWRMWGEAVTVPVPIRVFSVDDQELLREGLASIIARQPDMRLVAQASTGWEAIEMFRVHKPDVTLMEVKLPDMSGIDVLRSIRREFPGARVVMLTSLEGDVAFHRALKAGARAYSNKNISLERLIDVIRQVHNGKRSVPSELPDNVAERFGREVLTPREVEVLRRMAGGNRNQDIAKLLSISESTVKFHVKHIMAKLGASQRTEAVAIALRRGIIRL